jgi:hypothetical protein
MKPYHKSEMRDNYGAFTIGRVVEHRDQRGRLGHIIGFAQVEYDHCYEVILKVQWCDGGSQNTNPYHVRVL